MLNHRPNKKHKLVDLARYGTQARQDVRPNILIGRYNTECPIFKEGDILDANATLNLITDTFDEGKVFEVFSKEGQIIAERLDTLESNVQDNNDQLSTRIDNLAEKQDSDITRLREDVKAIEDNISNIKRIVDIRLQSTENGVKVYLVEKEDGTTACRYLLDEELGITTVVGGNVSEGLIELSSGTGFGAFWCENCHRALSLCRADLTNAESRKKIISALPTDLKFV